MFPSAIRRNLAGLIPPKIATPAAVSSGGTSARTAAVIEFYSKLPKGPKPESEKPTGVRKLFEGPRGGPLLAGILALFALGYTIDYQMHLKHHKNGHH